MRVATEADRACKRRYQRLRFHRWRAAGCCADCGLPVTKFLRCLACRAVRAKYDLARYYAKRQRQAEAA